MSVPSFAAFEHGLCTLQLYQQQRTEPHQQAVAVACSVPALSPLYVALGLTRAGLAEHASHLFWFVSGRPRALFDNGAAHRLLGNMVRELLRAAENAMYAMTPATVHVTGMTTTNIRTLGPELALALDLLQGSPLYRN